MELISIGEGEARVWINQAMVAWFWNYQGKLCVNFAGAEEMQTFDGITAEQFAERIMTPVS